MWPEQFDDIDKMIEDYLTEYYYNKYNKAFSMQEEYLQFSYANS